MARRKRKAKNTATVEPPAKKVVVNLSETAVIKRSLKAALKQPYSEHADLTLPESQREFSQLRQEIQRIVIEITKTLKAGSLNIHVHLSDLFQNGTRQAIETEFNQNIDKNYFNDFFRGLSMIHGNVIGYKLHETVRRMCLEYAINPPDIDGICNIVNFASQKYYVNFKNNICVHAYTRIRKFFYSKCRSKQRVYNTLHYLFHQNSEKAADPELIEALRELQPIGNFGDGAGYFFEMEKKWYRYVPLFMQLQE